MSKLALLNRLRREYQLANIQEIVRFIEEQVNQLSEGKIVARHDARTSAPTTGNWQRGDIIWNSEPAAAGFIGWVCVTSGAPGTWKTWGEITA